MRTRSIALHIVFILLALLPVACGGQPVAPPTTEEPPPQQPTTPQRRAHHAMVFDSANRRVLLVGGSTQNGSGFRFFNDLWAFDQTGWQLLGTAGEPMSGRALAYDSRRSRVLSFGGYCSCRSTMGGRYDTLFRLVGNVWEPIATIPTRPSSDAGMVYDARRDRLIVFGGVGSANQMLGDTWEFDGSAWARASTAGPAGRIGFGMAYDAQRDRTILFGGFSSNPGAPLRDTWIYDGASTTWTQFTTALGPSARHSFGITYDSRRQRVVIFGGYGANDALLQDTWAWDGDGWELLSDTGPGPRAMGYLAYDSVRDRIVLFGPYGTNASLVDTWEFDGASWSKR